MRTPRWCLWLGFALSVSPISGVLADELALTQDDVLNWVLSESPQAEFARLSSEIARTRIEYERGIFQPSLFSSLRRSDEEVSNSAEDRVIRSVDLFEEERDEFEIGIRTPLLTGAELSLSWSGIRRDNTYTRQLLEEGDKEFFGSAEVTLRQPLLRGFMAREVRLAIEQAELTYGRAQLVERKDLLDLVFQVLRQYWLVYRLDAFREIDAAALDNALATAESTEQLIEAGIQPPLARLQTDAMVLDREFRLARTESEWIDARAELAALLGADQAEAANWRVADTPEQRSLQVPDQLDPYIQTVLAQWPELMAAQMTAEIERSRIKAARDSGRPELDLILGYSSSGLRTSSADALSQSLEGRHPSWYVGLHLEVMLGANKRSRAESEAAGLRVLQAELDARTIRSNVAHRLRARVEGALSAHEDMQRMVRREVLQREIHLEQVALFEAGQIAVDALYRSMDDVIDVQRRLTDAQVQYQLAIISLRLIEGSLLPSAGGEARAPSLGFADS